MSKGNNLEKICNLVRRDTLLACHNAKIGHLGSSFSVIEILVALYFGVLKINPKNPLWEERDRFILSKGHAAIGLYSVLARKGFLPENALNSLLQDGSKLLVHPEWNGLPGIEHGTGSLGHGLPVGVGMAYAAKLLNKKYKVFVLISDSECQEGTTWESALFAGHHKLDNLVVILDYNGTQALGKVKEILDIEPITEKWRSFKFDTVTVDGHNLKSLQTELNKESEKPRMIIAKTVMGKGVSFMEGNFQWHYFDPKDKDVELALKELKIK